MAEDEQGRRSTGGGASDWGGSWDAALQRLEEFLLSYPPDRALPDLDTIITTAGVTREFLREDERAQKVIHEAIFSRPLPTVAEVNRVRAEVQLLTLEVDVLVDRMRELGISDDDMAIANARLVDVRSRLEEIRGLL